MNYYGLILFICDFYIAVIVGTTAAFWYGYRECTHFLFISWFYLMYNILARPSWPQYEQSDYTIWMFFLTLIIFLNIFIIFFKQFQIKETNRFIFKNDKFNRISLKNETIKIVLIKFNLIGKQTNLKCVCLNYKSKITLLLRIADQIRIFQVIEARIYLIS